MKNIIPVTTEVTNKNTEMYLKLSALVEDIAEWQMAYQAEAKKLAQVKFNENPLATKVEFEGVEVKKTKRAYKKAVRDMSEMYADGNEAVKISFELNTEFINAFSKANGVLPIDVIEEVKEYISVKIAK